MTRVTTWLALALGACLVAPVPALRAALQADVAARAKAALAPLAGDVVLDGLDEPVEVIRDRWGVAHVYAKTLDDLFFAQGFVAAQDRLWQLELWRRTAEGRLAEIAGPSAVGRDTFARLLRYRGDPEAEWRSYGPEARRIVEAFVRGVNAQIAHVTARPEQLPLEFQITGLRPSPWTPEVVISRMAGYVMTRNAQSEVQRARLAQAVGAARVAEFMPPDPPVPVTVPDGLDLADITADVLAMAADADAAVRLDVPATAPVGRFGPVAPARAVASALADAPGLSVAPRPATVLAGLADTYSTIGSNNWVVSGGRSTSGKPLLANDPHRALRLPSLRYTIHLNGPGWDVIGAGEPALPGVAAGHNGRVAFGFTIVGIDQQDLYVERLDPANPDRYLYKGQWDPVRVEREEIAVRGEPPRVVELRFTRHGPVVHVDRARSRAYALRWVGMEPGTAGYLASLSLNTARSWPEFLAAASQWKVPSENLVYADVDGNIGWIAAGLAPVRANWNGLMPVPGHEGRFEWDGFLPVRDLPQAYNPRSGALATANHNILPPGYPKMLGYEWGAPHRYRRIVELLEAKRTFTAGDFARLQHDELSIPARTIVDALRVAVTVRPVAPGDRARAVALLTGWDAVLDQQSAAAALYALWLPHLQRGLAEAVTKPEDRPYAPERLPLEGLLDLLGRPSPAHLEVLAGPALDHAMAEARQRMGDDPAAWAWGRLHRAHFEHPLATTPERAALLNLPDVPRGGDGTTVNNTGMELRQVHGASFREVIDLADWDRSLTINVPGQSGQPGSRHYGDLLPLWAAGQYHPLVFSRAAVERAAAERLWLLPKGVARPAPAPDAGSAAPPELPTFVGSLVNFDRRDGRVAACALEPGGGEIVIGARKVPRTFVWVIEPDRARQLGSTPGSCDPAWSPDGSRLAVAATNGLWTYSPTLGDPRLLAETHLPRQPKHESDYTAFSKPRWSPDGARLAYLVTNGATSWVEVVDAATGRRLYRSDTDTYGFEWTTDPRVLRVGTRTIRLP